MDWRKLGMGIFGILLLCLKGTPTANFASFVSLYTVLFHHVNNVVHLVAWVIVIFKVSCFYFSHPRSVTPHQYAQALFLFIQKHSWLYSCAYPRQVHSFFSHKFPLHFHHILSVEVSVHPTRALASNFSSLLPQDWKEESEKLELSDYPSIMNGDFSVELFRSLSRSPAQFSLPSLTLPLTYLSTSGVIFSLFTSFSLLLPIFLHAQGSQR